MPRQIDYGDGPKEVVASILTLETYEQEFHRDLIGDVWGKVEVTEDDLKRISGEESENGDVVLTIDYSDTDWLALVRALWACLRTADPSVPPYDEWKAEQGDMDLMAVRSGLMPVMNAGFFLAGAADSE